MTLRQRLGRIGLPVLYILLTIVGVQLFWNDVGTVETVAQGLTVAGQAVFSLFALAASFACLRWPTRSFGLAVGWAVSLTLTAAASPVTFGGAGVGSAVVAGLITGAIAGAVLWLHSWAEVGPEGGGTL